MIFDTHAHYDDEAFDADPSLGFSTIFLWELTVYLFPVSQHICWLFCYFKKLDKISFYLLII